MKRISIKGFTRIRVLRQFDGIKSGKSVESEQKLEVFRQRQTLRTRTEAIYSRQLLEPTDVYHQVAELQQTFIRLSLKCKKISTTMNTQTIALIRFESFCEFPSQPPDIS
jgi:hypothetical protein